MESPIRLASPLADPDTHWLIPDAEGAFHPTEYQLGQEFTGFVARERSLIGAELRRLGIESPIAPELFAAQQALAWAMDPEGSASPLEMIRRAHPDAFPVEAETAAQSAIATQERK